MKNRELWIFIETDEGKALGSSLELFTAAKAISAKTGGSITAVIIGSGIADEAKTLGAYGARKVIAVEAPYYSAANYTEIMYALAKKNEPDALMFSATVNAKDFAPRLACRLKTGTTANCTQLDADPETGVISWMMPAPGGVMATILCEKTRPQMGTVTPGMFKKPERDESKTAELVFESFTPAEDPVKLVESVRKAADMMVSIGDAEIIVAGGRGMGSPEGFELVRELAKVLGGAVGASRTVTDAEWVPVSHLIGASGTVVHPKLYIACGISGAIQHVVGVSADCIVAINKDASAPIFEIADYGIVGPAEKILPALIEEIKKIKG